MRMGLFKTKTNYDYFRDVKKWETKNGNHKYSKEYCDRVGIKYNSELNKA